MQTSDLTHTNSINEKSTFRWTILVTSMAFIVAQLDVSIVNIALPQIAQTFKIDISGLQWIVDGYTLAFAVLMLSAGNLSDLFGAKRLFQVGIFTFGVASVLCGFATTATMLIIARVMQGLGSAIMIPSSLSVLNQTFADVPQKRSKAVGFWTAAGSAAIAAGPIIGGIIVELSDWRYIFFINAPLCLGAILLTSRLNQPFKKPVFKGFDPFGQITWMASITLLIAALIEWPQLGIQSPVIYGSLILGSCCFALFIILEKKVKYPMLPLNLFTSPSFNVLLFVGAVLNGFYYGTVFILSLYLQKVLGYTPFISGLAFLPLTVGFVISNVLSGGIINRFGIRLPILCGLLIFGIGFAGLFIAGNQTPFWQLSIPFLLISLGMGMAVPAMTTGILSSVHKNLSGTASAALNTARQASGAAGVAILGAIAAGGNSAILHTIGLSAFAAIVLTIIVFALVFIYLEKKK